MGKEELHGEYDPSEEHLGEILLDAAKKMVLKIAEKQSHRVRNNNNDSRNIPEVLKKIFPIPKSVARAVVPTRKSIVEVFQDSQKTVERLAHKSIPEANWLGRITPHTENLEDFKKLKSTRENDPNFKNVNIIVETEPTDARTLEVLKKFYRNNPENGTQEVAREVAQDLVDVAIATGLSSQAAKEARAYLQKMKSVYGESPEIQALAELMGEEDIGVFYDLNLESIENESFKKTLIDIEVQIDTDMGQDEDWLEGYLNDIDRKITSSSEYDALKPEQRVIISKAKKIIENRLHSLRNSKNIVRLDDEEIQHSQSLSQRQSSEFGRINKFELTEDRLMRLYEDPYGEVEILLRQVREELERADQSGAENIQTQIGLYQERITMAINRQDSEAFLRRKKNHKGESYYDLMMKEENGDTLFEEFVTKRKKELSEVKDILNYRMGVMYSSYLIEKTGDPETAKKSLGNVGVLGLHHVLSQEGGMVDVVFQKYIELLNEARRDKDGNLQRFTTSTHREVGQRLKRELIQESDLYNKIYENTYGKEGDLLDRYRSQDEIDTRKKRRSFYPPEEQHSESGQPISQKEREETVDALILLAHDMAVITQRDVVPLLRARKPLPKNAGERASYILESAQEKVIDSMDIIRHFERYGRLTPGQKAMLRMSSIMAANSTGIGIKVDTQLREYMNEQGMNKGSLEAIAFLKEYFNDSEDQMRQFYQVDMKTGSKRDIESNKSWGDVTDKEIFYALKTQFGERVISSFAGHNDYFSSTWRIAEYVAQANQMYGSEIDSSGNPIARGVAMGMRLRIEGAQLLGAEDHESYEKAEKRVHTVWEEISQYRPQTILDVMIDGKSKDAFNQFTLLKNGNMFDSIKNSDGSPIKQPHQLVEALNRRYRIVESKLTHLGLPPIKYSDHNLSDAQRAVVEEVAKQLQDNSSEDFLRTMHSLAHWGEHKTHDLTKIQYREIYKTTYFTDDSRNFFRANPNDAIGFHTENRGQDPDVLNIGLRFTNKGMGEADVLVRTWGDAMIAKDLPQLVYLALDPDKKKHFGSIEKIMALVPNLGGDKQLYRGSMYLSGGYMKLGTVKTLHDWLFMEAAYNSAPSKEWFGQHAEVLGLTERHQMASDLALLLRGVPDDVAKESAEWYEDYLGLKKAVTRDGRVIHFSTLPYKVYKARLALVVIAGIVSTAAVTQAIQGFTGSDDVKGGGGHGGGASHH